VENDDAKLNQDLDPTVPYPIHCCLCLNEKPNRKVPAITMIQGYAVCEKHEPVIRRHDFNFSALLQFGQRNAT
jgi:hypothetical protein